MTSSDPHYARSLRPLASPARWMSLAGAMLGLSLVPAKAALVYHLTFDGATPGENAGTGGAIPWGGAAPANGNLVSSAPGMGNAYNTASHNPWTNALGNASFTFAEGTVSFWTNGATTSWDDYFSFGAVGSAVKLERTDTGKVALYLTGTPVTTTAIESTSTLTNGTWNLVTLTFNSTTNQAILYINGVQEAQTTWTGSAAISQFQLGSELGATSRTIVSSFDDVRLYNNALSALEVAALMPVPEPSVALLGGLGALALLRRRRAL